MASRSLQPAGSHDLARTQRGSGVRPAGLRTPGSEAVAEPGEEGGPGRSRRPRRHSGDTWHFRFRLEPAAVLSVPGELPRGQLTVSPVRTVHGLACHVTDPRRPPEVACVTTTKIPGVENVTCLTDRGSEGGADF